LAGGALNLAPPLLVRGRIDDAIPAGRATGSATPLRVMAKPLAYARGWYPSLMESILNQSRYGVYTSR
jgi:hypothetical protein